MWSNWYVFFVKFMNRNIRDLLKFVYIVDNYLLSILTTKTCISLRKSNDLLLPSICKEMKWKKKEKRNDKDNTFFSWSRYASVRLVSPHFFLLNDSRNVTRVVVARINWKSTRKSHTSTFSALNSSLDLGQWISKCIG